MNPRVGLPALLVVLVLASVPLSVQAAPQPEAPGDFKNAQENHFGSVTMEPYLSVGEGSLPIEARFVLRDLEALGQAADVLFAFNVKGDAVRATFEGLRTADGKVLAPLRTDTVDRGRQPQAHFAPADLLAVAKDGRIDLVLAGRVEGRADSQSHVGAMAIAFDGSWGTLPSGDGSAQLYGFTMVSVTGVGGGIMPFQGQGNTWSVLPLALVAMVVALAGTLAVSVLLRMPPQAPLVQPAAATPSGPAASAIPTFGQPARSGPASSTAKPTAAPSVPTAAPSARPATAAAPIPVFGGPASPAVPVRSAAPAPRPAPLGRPPLPSGSVVPMPLQGPLLPPHPLDRTPLLGPDAGPPAPAPAAVAETTATLPARPPVRVPASARPARPVAKATGAAVLTATKRPKARSSGKAAASPSSRQPPRERVPQASR